MFGRSGAKSYSALSINPDMRLEGVSWRALRAFIVVMISVRAWGDGARARGPLLPSGAHDRWTGCQDIALSHTGAAASTSVTWPAKAAVPIVSLPASMAFAKATAG